MLWLALALTAGWATSVLALVGTLDRQRRQAGRREDLLIGQMAHLAGKPFPQEQKFRAPVEIGPPELVDPDQWPDEELA